MMTVSHHIWGTHLICTFFKYSFFPHIFCDGHLITYSSKFDFQKVKRFSRLRNMDVIRCYTHLNPQRNMWCPHSDKHRQTLIIEQLQHLHVLSNHKIKGSLSGWWAHWWFIFILCIMSKLSDAMTFLKTYIMPHFYIIMSKNDTF